MSSARIFSADFETTVYKGQTDTLVWASASVELGSEDVQIFHSIDEQWDYFTEQAKNGNIIVYYHNLKFDGSFWLDFFLKHKKFQPAYYHLDKTTNNVKWMKPKLMKNYNYQYIISDRGQWYTITVKVHGHYIEFRDSLKLLPFSVKDIGKGFDTKHRKLDMEYTGFRYPGCVITDEEKKYIANDVLVVKEALEQMFKDGHTKLTIGACCFAEFKRGYSKEDYEIFFPDMVQYSIDETKYNELNADAYIRHSYRGGWCYLVKGKESRIYHNGTTADVNSLYPSMMSSESGNRYPVGKPYFWKGNYIPDDAKRDNRYYFVRIKTRFYIKPNKLPFVQIKGSPLYKGTEALVTSDVWDKKSKSYKPFYKDTVTGIVHDTRVELTLTMTDYQLLQDQYELVECEILDGCWFYSEIGLFDKYMEKYKQIKMTSKGARRLEAKLFLNNLYGKLASSTDSSFKVAYLRPDNSVGFFSVAANEKKAGYIPIGSAITSYARNFTIRAAQENYHGVDKPGFIYADTDSIHCDLPPEKIKGIKVHKSNFCCWALESCWDDAIFVRQKTYIEHVTHEDCEPIEEPYYDIKCAGMPQRCKDLFNIRLTGEEPDEETKEKYTDEQREFLYDDKGNLKRSTLEDFKINLTVPGKLMPKRINGGVLLVESSYCMR